jgi:hypothetical protein
MVVSLSGCGEVVTSHYAMYQDAINDDLFIRGWLPDILPETTTNIKTTNNLDLNTSSGYFDLPKSDIAMFALRLTRMPNGKYSYSYGAIVKEPTWVFEIDNDSGHVTYVLSAD